ncbi:hypothetical protein E2542_SST06090 [Spatholobus suberectus]|nr:hypothetical protein E2542_SST06090 [Spatholobus suberectus]
MGDDPCPVQHMVHASACKVVIIRGESQRLQNATCGDIDIIITHPDRKRLLVRLRLVGRHLNLGQLKILNRRSKGRFPKQSGKDSSFGRDSNLNDCSKERFPKQSGKDSSFGREYNINSCSKGRFSKQSGKDSRFGSSNKYNFFRQSYVVKPYANLPPLCIFESSNS